MEKYGKSEVEQWYWEVWNEPNIGYWKGTKEEFFKLQDYAIDGVKKALPAARVGGSDCAGSGGSWQRDFIAHCLHGTNYATGRVGTPLDFLSFHAKGSPSFVNGHVRMGISNQLRAIDEGFGIVASFPESKGKPIVIGESDPDGCAACTGPQLAYRNTTMYSSYSAASFGRELEIADRRGVNLEGADLGLRIRESADLRRLPRDGDHGRDQRAGLQRLPHVGQDERQAGRRGKQRGDTAG